MSHHYRRPIRPSRASEQMYLLMIKDFNGKRICPKRTMQCGLAAAVLGDLVIAERIAVNPVWHHVMPIQYGGWDYVGELGEHILNEIWSAAPAKVGDWLDRIGPLALVEVPRQLERLDILYYGGPWPARRWRLIDSNLGLLPLTALQYILRNPGNYQGEPTDTLLLGLLEATLLTDKLFYPRQYPDLEEHIKAFIHTLPPHLHPSLQTLIASTQHIIGNATLTHV